MIIPGICSITLKNQTPEQVVNFLTETNLSTVEWWSGDHVPPGDLPRAERIGRITREAGKSIVAYGSYYRVGTSEPSGDSFAPVLDSASALGAPTIRVWAGDRDTKDADAAKVDKIVADSFRIADLAAGHGISITFEFHGSTLTDNNRNAATFAERVKHPNIFFSWQAPHGFDQTHCLEGLNRLLPRLSTVHVYHWTIGSKKRNLFNSAERILQWPDDFHRHPLVDGMERWEEYMKAIRASDQNHPALLEFVRDDSIEQAKRDSATLIALARTAG